MVFIYSSAERQNFCLCVISFSGIHTQSDINNLLLKLYEKILLFQGLQLIAPNLILFAAFPI